MNKKLSLTPLLQGFILMAGLMLFSFNVVLAQGHAVRGKVADANGNPIAGANISEKGGKKGVISDAEGNFTLTVASPQAVLVFSYVGYNTIEVPVKGEAVVNATLQVSSSNTLSGVVVTALGITRNKRSLGYDVGQLAGDDVNRVAQTNVLNGMAGKVSGVVVNSTGSSPNASVSVVIRGIRSLNNDNQPLFVVDGVPLQNSMNNIGTNNGNGNDVDYGNVISDLNPNDIESMSILKRAQRSSTVWLQGWKRSDIDHN